MESVFKILRVDHELILGEMEGFLQVFDIKTSSITQTHSFEDIFDIYDIVAID